MLTVGSLFSGIGGFELGLERTGGFKTAWQCEKDEFCLKVLAKHWPDVKRFTDIHEMKEDIPYVDVICGGFPCQPVSCAGKRKGAQDERWLWPEFYRIVCEVRPEWVIIENVPGLLSADSGRLFAGILRDLSSSGYDAEWNIVSAAFVGAPHLRKRVFIVAHTDRQPSEPSLRNLGRGDALVETEQSQQELGRPSSAPREVSDPIGVGRHGRAGVFGQGWRGEPEDCGAASTDADTEGLAERNRSAAEGGPCTSASRSDGRPAFCRLGIFTDGLSEGLADAWRPGWEDGTSRLATGQKDRVNRLKALGNAIVPQCSEYVGWCILEAKARQ